MASQTDSEFRTYTDRTSVCKKLNSKDHDAVRMNLLVWFGGKPHVLMGEHWLFYNMTPFGGNEKKPDETLAQTLKRKTTDQTLDCIMLREELGFLLYNKGVLLERNTDSGNEYTAFIDMTDREFPFDEVLDCFNRKRRRHYVLTRDQSKFHSLHAIPLKSLKRNDHGKIENVETITSSGRSAEIYKEAMPALRHVKFPLMPDWW